MRPIASQPRHNIAVRLFEPPAPRAGGRVRILLLKLDHIGDFITALDAFRLLRQAFADAEMTLICLPAVVGLAQSTGLFDRVAGFSAMPDSAQLGKTPKMHADDKIAQFQSLLDGRYFLAADFRHDPFDRFGLDHVDADCRAAFAAPTMQGLDIVIPTMEWDVASAAVAGKNLPVSASTRMKLLAQAIIDSLIENPCELFEAAENVRANPAYRALAQDKRLKIGLSTGAGSELRKWNSDYWVKLLSQLAQAYPACFVFFGGEGDRHESATLAASLPPGCCVDLTGMTPLADVPTYMKLLDAYIGCDTGLTHLAASLDIPTVNIFAGISNISVWRARGRRVKTVYAEVICSPCHLRFKKDCPNNNICMGAIVPEIVFACFESQRAESRK